MASPNPAPAAQGHKHVLTPAELAISEERRQKRLERARQETLARQSDPRGEILPREWIRLDEHEEKNENVQPEAGRANRVKVMSFNLLAQCLVRRELFPTSDCLKAAQREHMLYREILNLDADICCLQEVDRTEKLFPILQDAGYAVIYAAAPRKKHGCAIAFRESVYEEVGKRLVQYDEEEIHPVSASEKDATEDEVEQAARTRRASSRSTTNIASIVALKRIGDDDEFDGLVIATTHLFWHPAYTYERARQAGILFREVDKFRHELGHSSWPCIVAGDFNFQPDNAVYSLIAGDVLLPWQRQTLAHSRVVHMTIDPSVPYNEPTPVTDEGEDTAHTQTGTKDSGNGEAEGESGGDSSDPDRVIMNARPAQPEDGLLSDEELVALFAHPCGRRPVSAYDSGLRALQARGNTPLNVDGLVFGGRVQMPPGRHGAHEPTWTSYTFYWKTVLDYIFVLDTPETPISIVALAKPHTTDKLEPGLPQKGICGSDHISLAAELVWPKACQTATKLP